jgi:O-antigen ligase
LSSRQASSSGSSQRLGAWAAADGMWQASPWHGHGPGSYARDGQPYRLAAEQRLQRRLLPPVTATGFAEAHNDYLQLAAEAGLPALLVALLGLGMLLDRLFLRASDDPEARALAGMLVAGAVAALAWFPLQVPLLALMLLLGLGRAWRLIAEPAR